MSELLDPSGAVLRGDDEPEGHPMSAARGEAIIALLQELVGIARFQSGYGLVRTPNARRAEGDVFAVSVPNVALQAVTLIEPNPYRRGAAIYNDAPATLYVALGSKVDADHFTIPLNQGDYYEPTNGYRGVIKGAWSAAVAGQARVTEFN